MFSRHRVSTFLSGWQANRRGGVEETSGSGCPASIGSSGSGVSPFFPPEVACPRSYPPFFPRSSPVLPPTLGPKSSWSTHLFFGRARKVVRLFLAAGLSVR